MSYLELLKLALPEAIVTLTALIVLAIGVVTGRRTVVTGVAPTKPRERAAGTAPASLSRSSADTAAASTATCTLVAAFGLILAIAAIVMLPSRADLFHGMLVISPLNSLFEIVCLVLAFFTILLASRETSNYGEYLAIVLLATIGLL